LKKTITLTAVLLIIIFVSGAGYPDFDALTHPDTGVLSGGGSQPGALVFDTLHGVSPAMYNEDGVYNISAVFPKTESGEINRDILAYVQGEIDYFKSLAESGGFEMRYEARSYNRLLVSFKITAVGWNGEGEVVLNRARGLAYDLLTANRLVLGDLVDGGFGFELAGKEFNSFAFDTENLYLYLDTEIIMPISEFGKFFRAADYYTNITAGAGFAENTAEDAHFPADASLPPGWRKINPLLDLFEEKVKPAFQDNKKYIALTFDDGPCRSVTTRILDALAEYDAKATFFVLGHKIPILPDIVERMFREGHSVGNHSYNHRQLTQVTSSQMNWQILETNRLIESITGSQVILLRPPYGDSNSRITDFAKSLDMSIITWDIDPRDWTNSNAQSIADHIVQRAQDGSIILMHDVYEWTADAAEIVIKTLSEKDFVFVTVEELINMNDGLVPGVTYRSGKSTAR